MQTTEIKPAPKCDHCAITLKLATDSPQRGCGLWKMNNSLLKDEDYMVNMKLLIKKFKLENPHMNPQMKWDMCKIKIKEYTIRYSEQKHKEKNEAFKQLQTEFMSMSCKTDENPSKENKEELKQTKIKLDQWLT